MEAEERDKEARVDILAENSNTKISPSKAGVRFALSISGTSLSKLPPRSLTKVSLLTKRVTKLPTKYAPPPTIKENTVLITAPFFMASSSLIA